LHPNTAAGYAFLAHLRPIAEQNPALLREFLRMKNDRYKFWYFDVFAGKGVKKTGNPAKEAPKKEERKEK
jgi:hypothetical protein